VAFAACAVQPDPTRPDAVPGWWLATLEGDATPIGHALAQLFVTPEGPLMLNFEAFRAAMVRDV